jgi:hypothetical protein
MLIATETDDCDGTTARTERLETMASLFRFPGRSRRRAGDDAEPGAILTEDQHELLAAELALLERLALLLDAYPGTPEDRREVRRAALSS